jgi:hypothetical protein
MKQGTTTRMDSDSENHLVPNLQQSVRTAA